MTKKENDKGMDEAGPPIQRIMYKVVEFHQSQSPQSLEDYLNTLGDDGWQLVHIVGQLGAPSVYGVLSQEEK